jgi:hypothetical protein
MVAPIRCDSPLIFARHEPVGTFTGTIDPSLEPIDEEQTATAFASALDDIKARVSPPFRLTGIRAKTGRPRAYALEPTPADLANIFDGFSFSPVFASVLPTRQTFQVRGIIVLRIAVAVVNIVEWRDFTIDASPYLPRGTVVFTGVFHGRIISPYRSSANGINPFPSIQTG